MKTGFVSSVNVELAFGSKVYINRKGKNRAFKLWGFRVTQK
jgi:hypothetical protein